MMKLTYHEKVLKLVEQEFLNIFKIGFEEGKFNKEFDIEDNVILGLYNGMIKRIDSIFTLYSVDKFTGCESIARSAFEAKVFLLYILERHTVDRAKAYHYSSKFKTIRLGKDLLDTGVKGVKIREFLNISLNEFKEQFEVKLNEDIERVTEKYNEYIGKNKNWYQYKGNNNNLRELCESLGIAIEYDLLFKFFSDETHSKDAANQFKITPVAEEEKIGLIEFNERNIDHVISFCLLSLVDITRMILRYYNLSVRKRKFDQRVELIYRTYNTNALINS